MKAEVLDGRPVAREMAARARDELSAYRTRYGISPRLSILRVGDDKASVAYERAILHAGGSVGIGVSSRYLPSEASGPEVSSAIEQLNQTSAVNGVIVLQPLPAHLSRFSVADVLDPEKDVDGITTYNAGRLFHDDRHVLAPSTPAGGMALLKHYGVQLAGRHAVVVGRSSVVGKPMAMMLLAEHATVTICHSQTRNLEDVCRTADVLVSATGRAGLITGEFIKRGATVVDFGVNFVDGCMTGDIDLATVGVVAGRLTPVPGGTGRVTTMVLVRNTIKAAFQQHDPGSLDVLSSLASRGYDAYSKQRGHTTC